MVHPRWLLGGISDDVPSKVIGEETMIEIGPNLLKAIEAVSICAFLATVAIVMYLQIRD